ncbi:MAG: hypothetical protein JWO13_2786 [Acidobacteriales bacterium]|nr:hypothetical protein [Terriglobales bacterium]
MNLQRFAFAAAISLLSILAVAQLPATPQVHPGDAFEKQSSKSASITTFKARTELVTVPVIVLRNGQHVSGLSKDDFELQEDGHAKKIASFEEIVESKPKVKLATPPPGVYTNEVLVEEPISVVVILLDLINTPVSAQANARKRLLAYLQNEYRADRPTMLAVLHPSGLRVLHDFTSDPQVLIKIVKKMTANVEHDSTFDGERKAAAAGVDQKIDSSATEAEVNSVAATPDSDLEFKALEQEFMGGEERGAGGGFKSYENMKSNDYLQGTFYQLQQLSRALSAVRGSKSLVWVFSGFTLPSSMDWRTGIILEDYARTLKMFSAANISVYSIDAATETDNPGFVTAQSQGGTATLMPFTSSVQPVQNLMDISQKTGGDYCLMRRQPDNCFGKAIDYSSRYYLLTYYVQPSDKIRWRKLSVKVRGQGLQVRARSGFYSAVTTSDSPDRRKQDIAQAFSTPVEYRALPISVRWNPASAAPVAKVAPIATAKAASTPALAVPDATLQQRNKRSFLLGITADAITVDAGDNNHIKLAIVAIALDDHGKILADVSQVVDIHPTEANLARMREKGFAYANELMIPPRTTKVRFLVRDDLGERVGTISTPIEALQ